LFDERVDDVTGGTHNLGGSGG